MRLNGKTAIVTGGGRGIGRAIALFLAEEGANVTVSARTQSEIDGVAAEIRSLGQRAIAIPADVTRLDDVEQVVEQTLAEFGRIDILVNNAGGVPSEMYDPSGSLHMPEGVWETLEEGWDRMMEVNLKSVFLCMKAVMPHMIQQGQGDIVNIASLLGRRASRLGGVYGVAKHTVIALTQHAALQAVPYGVRISAVSPGLVDTASNK